MKTILSKNHVFLLALYWVDTGLLSVQNCKTLSHAYADGNNRCTISLPPNEEITHDEHEGL